MTKKEIVKLISERANLTQLKTKEIVQWTFDAIIDTLISDGRIELRNFGVFEVKKRKPRKARNPRTGAKVEVAAKNVVTFQPGKEMEERVKHIGNVAEKPVKQRRNRAAASAAPATVPGQMPVTPPAQYRPAATDAPANGRTMEPALSGSASG